MKLLTQLYGDRMIIANATGCSSIWGASAPSRPLHQMKTAEARPVNSLFEDNAEFGYGMLLAAAHMQDKITQTMKDMLQRDIPEQLKEAVDEWIEARNDGEASKNKSAQLLKVIDGRVLWMMSC